MRTLRAHPLLAALGGIGLVLFILLNWGPLAEPDPSADPNAPPPIGKAAAAADAERFAIRQFDLNASDAFVVYKSLTDLSGYLQRSQSFDLYRKLWGKRLPLDYYEVAFTEKSGTRRHVLVDVDMETGRVFAWNGAPADAASGATAAAGGTEQAARAWLDRAGYDSRSFVLGSGSASTGRWSFREVRPVGEAVLNVQLEYRGGQAAALLPSVKLPQPYLKWMNSQQSWAQKTDYLYMGLSLLLAVAALIAAIAHRRRIKLIHGVFLTVLFAAIYLFNNFNMYPAFKSAPGAGSGVLALADLIVMDIVTFGMAAAVYLSLMGGEAMWNVRGWAPIRRWRDPLFGTELLQGMIRGYCLGGLVMGAQAVLFRAEDGLFHVWSTNDPTDSPLNLFVPLLFPVMAWAAAISEEAMYRLFGIALFKKLVRNTFLAVLFPSFLWALGHAAYPIYPFYTRLIEVTALGLIFGFAFLRYGLYTTLFAHAVMDSVLMSLNLLMMGNRYLPICIGYIALPFLLAGLITLLHQRRHRPLHSRYR